MSEKTPEQLKAEQDAAAAAQAKKDQAAKEKAEKQAAKDAAKKEREEKAAAAKLEKQKAAEQKKLDAAAKREADKAAKEQAKKDAEAAREAARMPEQNGIRRPKPDTLCGKAWAIFDQVSAKNGSPASISESMEIAKGQSLNEANVRAEYARWRKFHGISGRIDAPKAAEPAPAEGAQAAA